MHRLAVFAVGEVSICFIRFWNACGVARARSAWHPRTPERSITHDRTSSIYTMPLAVSCSYTSCYSFKYHNVHHAERRCSEEAHFLGLFVLSLPEGEGETLGSAHGSRQLPCSSISWYGKTDIFVPISAMGRHRHALIAHCITTPANILATISESL